MLNFWWVNICTCLQVDEFYLNDYRNYSWYQSPCPNVHPQESGPFANSRIVQCKCWNSIANSLALQIEKCHPTAEIQCMIFNNSEYKQKTWKKHEKQTYLPTFHTQPPKISHSEFLEGPSFWCQIRATDHDALHRDQTFDIRGIPGSRNCRKTTGDNGKPSRGGGNWGTLRIPREDRGTLGKIRGITTPPLESYYTLSPIIMVQWIMGVSPIGSLPFKYPAIFHWTMIMGERVSPNKVIFKPGIGQFLGGVVFWSYQRKLHHLQQLVVCGKKMP